MLWSERIFVIFREVTLESMISCAINEIESFLNFRDMLELRLANEDHAHV